jgi:hypothetical protein
VGNIAGSHCPLLKYIVPELGVEVHPFSCATDCTRIRMLILSSAELLPATAGSCLGSLRLPLGCSDRSARPKMYCSQSNMYWSEVAQQNGSAAKNLEQFSCLLHRYDVANRILANSHMKNVVFWDDTPCGSCKISCFGETYCHHYQGEKSRQAKNNLRTNLQLKLVFRLLDTADVVPRPPVLVSLKTEAMRSSRRRFLQEPHGVTFQ